MMMQFWKPKEKIDGTWAIPVVEISNREKSAILLLLCWRALNWMIATSGTDNRLLIFCFIFIQACKLFESFNICSETVAKELTKLKKTLPIPKDLEILTAGKNNLRLGYENYEVLSPSTENDFRIIKYDGFTSFINYHLHGNPEFYTYKISWEIGKSDLYRLFNQAINLVQTAQQSSELTKDEKQSFPSVPLFYKQSIKYLLPHIERNLDMPSKLSVVEFFLKLPFWIAGEKVADMVGIPPDWKFTFTAVYAVISWCLARLETAKIKDFETRLTLEGWARKYPSFFLNSCLGQQIRRYWNFFPVNKEFDKLTQFIIETFIAAHQVEQNRLNQDTPIMHSVKSYKEKCARVITQCDLANDTYISSYSLLDSITP